jgi:hypothetical protein
MVVDQPGCHSATAQVYGSGARAGAGIAISSDRRELSILDDDFRRHGVLPIHGHDPAVGEVQIAGTGAAGVRLRLGVNQSGSGC